MSAYALIENNEDGNLIPDGVQYERLVVPLLLEVKSLRARVAALEGSA